MTSGVLNVCKRSFKVTYNNQAHSISFSATLESNGVRYVQRLLVTADQHETRQGESD